MAKVGLGLGSKANTLPHLSPRSGPPRWPRLGRSAPAASTAKAEEPPKDEDHPEASTEAPPDRGVDTPTPEAVAEPPTQPEASVKPRRGRKAKAGKATA